MNNTASYSRKHHNGDESPVPDSYRHNEGTVAEASEATLNTFTSL